ncbi:MAG TPA: hypothetical protein VIS74_01850, partial [Chthoniobacterales bacterium]
RATMIQLRDAQAQIATLQATQVENEQKITDLTAQLETLANQAAADQQTAKKTIDDLNARITEQDTKLAQLIEALGKWKKAYNQAADLARAKENERAKLANKVILLDRRIADQQTKNDALYQIGNEILTRYEKFSLGDALTAREPFVGITRVKIQNLVQDYQDKLTDQKIQ